MTFAMAGFIADLRVVKFMALIQALWSEAIWQEFFEGVVFIVSLRLCNDDMHLLRIAEFSHELSADSAWRTVITDGLIRTTDNSDTQYLPLSTGNGMGYCRSLSADASRIRSILDIDSSVYLSRTHNDCCRHIEI